MNDTLPTGLLMDVKRFCSGAEAGRGAAGLRKRDIHENCGNRGRASAAPARPFAKGSLPRIAALSSCQMPAQHFAAL
mgnify:CR=1 FL=1